MRSRNLPASAAKEECRVVATVKEIRGKCPLYNLGDKIKKIIKIK